MKKVIIVAGARPNFMKIAPIFHQLEDNMLINAILVHSGQHYDQKMSDVFFEDLNIPKPDYNLNVRSGSHAEQTAKIMISFEEVCLKEKPDLVIVVGDINSTLACAVTAKKIHIKVAHIESGLRSNDRLMPEEINRLVTDSITDYFFVTEDSGEKNLLFEGHDKSDIYYVGNLMIDSLYYGLKKIESEDKFDSSDYGVITLHRPSNVDDINKLKELIEALSIISKSIKLYFSIHPRTKNIIDHHNLNISNNIKIVDSLPYLDFLHMMRDSKVVFTDSGGIQEETTILKIPCYTIRENTERPITISQGTNELVGIDKDKIIDRFNNRKFDINKNYQIPNGWDGKAAYRIVNILEKII